VFSSLSDIQRDRSVIGKKTVPAAEELTIASKNLQASESQKHRTDIADVNTAGKDSNRSYQSPDEIKIPLIKGSRSQMEVRLLQDGEIDEPLFFEGEFIESTSFAPISDSPKKN
jgi:hypothetical protein